MTMNQICVCTLIFNEDNTKILAVSRKNDNTILGLPGGKYEKDLDGISYLNTAERETLEETGYVIVCTENSYVAIDCYDNIVITYLANINKSIPQKEVQETGIVAWTNPIEVTKGVFGNYNKEMFNHFGIKYD